MIEYTIWIELDAAEAVPAVQDVLAHMNDALSTCGVDERLTLQPVRLQVGVLTLQREPSEKEISQMKTIMLSEFLTGGLSFAKSITGLKLERRRKSGNVSFVSP